MGGYSLEDFTQSTGEKTPGQGAFELEIEHLPGVNLNGVVWTKTGSTVAYKGDMRFKAEGRGKLYLADRGKKVSVLKLVNDSIYVNCNDILAIEDPSNGISG